MTYRLSERSKLRLEGLHPDLARVVARAIMLTEVDFMVAEGVRGKKRQADLVRLGRSLTFKSKHLRQPDGYAHAVDLVAVGDLDGDGEINARDKLLTWTEGPYFRIACAMFAAAQELNVSVRWGGHFRGFFDGPHFELRGA